MTRTARVQSGDTLASPITGERSTFTGTAATTNGELVVFGLDLRPGGAVPMRHVHAGAERAVRGHCRPHAVPHRPAHRSREAGDVVEIKPGVVHGLASDGQCPACSAANHPPTQTNKEDR
jgi:hypothetical protein